MAQRVAYSENKSSEGFIELHSISENLMTPLERDKQLECHSFTSHLSMSLVLTTAHFYRETTSRGFASLPDVFPLAITPHYIQQSAGKVPKQAP